MNKMNLREFAEVMAVLVNKAGMSCIIDNNGQDGQLRFAAKKGDIVVYTDVSSLWKQCNETGADIQPLANALAQALSNALAKGEANMPKRPQPQYQPNPQSQKKQFNAEDMLRKAILGESTSAQKPVNTQTSHNTEEKTLNDVLNEMFRQAEGTAKSGCTCNGDKCSSSCKEHAEEKEYDPMDDVPEYLRPAVEAALDALGKKLGINIPNECEETTYLKSDRIFDRKALLENIMPMFSTSEEVEQHPDVLYRTFFDMRIVYYIKSDFCDKIGFPHRGPAVLAENVLKEFGLTEKDVYDAAIKNIAKMTKYSVSSIPLGNENVKSAVITTPNGEGYGAAGILASNALKTVARELNDEVIFVMIVSDDTAFAIPASQVDTSIIENILKNMEENILSDNLYAYHVGGNCIACPAYNLD